MTTIITILVLIIVFLLIYGRSKKPKEGLDIIRYKNGNKKEEVMYVNGEKHGLHTSWYENGQKQIELPYDNGIINGLSTTWYENGQKRSEIPIKDGKQEGHFKEKQMISIKEWNKDGSVIE